MASLGLELGTNTAGPGCVWGLGTDGSWKRKLLTILTQSMRSFKLFVMNFRPLCEPLLVFQDILGANGAELQQQKTVQNRDFPRPIWEREEFAEHPRASRWGGK